MGNKILNKSIHVIAKLELSKFYINAIIDISNMHFHVE